MILACGFENYIGALFHLFTHAFFKALLFLTAGYLIHTIVDEQDVRMFGAAYYNKVPIHYAGLFIGSIILAGLPMCSGMLSKDFILETGNASVFIIQANFFIFVSTISIFFSTLYSVRMLYLSFFVRTNPNKVQLLRLSFDGNFISIGVIVVLSFCSIVFGYLFEDVFRIHNFRFFDNVGYYRGMDVIYIEHEFVSTFVKLIPSIFMVLAVIAYFIIRHVFSIHFSNFGNWFFINKFGIDYIYGKIFNVLFQVSLKIYLILEKGLFSVDYVNFFLKLGTKSGTVFNRIM